MPSLTDIEKRDLDNLANSPIICFNEFPDVSNFGYFIYARITTLNSLGSS